MLLNNFFYRGQGISPGHCRNIVNSAANAQILYGLKSCVRNLYCDEVAKKYNIQERKMLRAAFRREQGTCNEAVEIDAGMLKLSQRIEKESLLTYGKMAFTPGIHNDILEIAEELNTKTIKKWAELMEEHNITSFYQTPFENLQE